MILNKPKKIVSGVINPGLNAGVKYIPIANISYGSLFKAKQSTCFAVTSGFWINPNAVIVC